MELKNGEIKKVTLEHPMPFTELQVLAKGRFGDFVKAVVDVEREVMALGAGLHADEEAVLLDDGSREEHLWGINIYPDRSRAEWIEYDSMVNIRPLRGNRSRAVEDEGIRVKIKEVVEKLVV